MRGLTFPPVLLLIFLFALFCQCGGNSDVPENIPPVLNVEEYSSTISPGDDFYQYVNEKWITDTELPEGYAVWTIFDELEIMRDDALLHVLSSPSKETPYELYSDEWKASEFFSIGMDSLLAENFGVQPIAQFVSRIESIGSVNQLANFLIFQEAYQIAGFFSFSVKPDPGNANKMGLYLEADKLGLIEASNYLSEDLTAMELRQRYVRHIDKMFDLAGLKADSTISKAVLSIESQLAGGLKGKVEDSEEGKRRYLTTEELGGLSPSINWSAYLSSMGFYQVDSIIVEDMEILKVFESILSNESMKDIKSYLTWHLIRNSAPYLHHSLLREHVSFEQFRDGKTQLQARRNRVLTSVNKYMGEAVGKLYVGHSFSPNAKLEAQNLVNTLKVTFANRIKNLNWMSDSTKLVALDRLRSLRLKIGYPDRWKTYSELITDRGPELGSYWQNVMNGRLFEFQQRAEKLGKSLDSGAWRISPQEVSVHYDSLYHELVVPAAILQKPLFDSKGDRSANYGLLGSLLGREISKVMDPIRYAAENGQGELERYSNARQTLLDQFTGMVVLDSIPIKGEEVVELSIADMAGLVVAFNGLKRSRREEGESDAHFESRFFGAWARLWRSKYDGDFLLNKVMNERHLPERNRVNTALSNYDEFYSSFDITPGSKMYISDSLRVKIW